MRAREIALAGTLIALMAGGSTQENDVELEKTADRKSASEVQNLSAEDGAKVERISKTIEAVLRSVLNDSDCDRVYFRTANYSKPDKGFYIAEDGPKEMMGSPLSDGIDVAMVEDPTCMVMGETATICTAAFNVLQDGRTVNGFTASGVCFKLGGQSFPPELERQNARTGVLPNVDLKDVIKRRDLFIPKLTPQL